MLKTKLKPQVEVYAIILLFFCVGSYLCLHPRSRNVLRPAAWQAKLTSTTLSAKEMWQVIDASSNGYRSHVSNRVLPAPWQSPIAQGLQIEFKQVSSYYAPFLKTIDLIPHSISEVADVAQWFDPLWVPEKPLGYWSRRTDAGVYILRIVEPATALQANGYYYEDRSIRGNYWVSIQFIPNL